MDGHIKLTDFGLCKIGMEKDEVEVTHSFCGSPEYMVFFVLNNAKNLNFRPIVL